MRIFCSSCQFLPALAAGAIFLGFSAVGSGYFRRWNFPVLPAKNQCSH